MTGPIRLIVVGLGARAQYWLRVIAASPDATIVGLVDPNPEARLRALAQCPGATASANLDDIVGKIPADAILLATPPHGRDDQIARACAARLPIFAEKPLADTLETATRYVTMAELAKIPLMVGLNFRYLPVTEMTTTLFETEVGPPAFARFTYERWRDGTLPHLNKYPLTMDQPMLWEQSIHHFDLMRHLYQSEPVEIFAKTFNPPWSMYAHDANVSALITFANGVIVNYQGTWAGNFNNLGFEWRHDCARGIVTQRDMFGKLAFARHPDPVLTEVELPPYEHWIDDAAALLSAFIATLRGEKPLACSGADHLNSLRMVQACILSSNSGRAIDPSDLQNLAEREIGRENTRNPQKQGKLR